jgi:hypothetical protein
VKRERGQFYATPHRLVRARPPLASLPGPEEVTLAINRKAKEIGIDLTAVQRATGDRERVARCGACGAEWRVTDFMRNDPDQARPDEPHDSFYCGCQNDDDLAEGEILPDLGDR